VEKVPAQTRKPRTGRPPFVPTEQQRKLAMLMTASGNLQRIIADRFGIDVATLRKHFREELDEGREATNAAVGDVLLRKALSGDIKAIENWLDRRGTQAWRKITGSEHAGPDGSPLQIVATARRDLSHLSDDELETFHRLTAKLEAPDAATPR
jgi:hypothetical protein